MSSAVIPAMEFSWKSNTIQVSGNNEAKESCLSMVEETLIRYGAKPGYYRNLKNSHFVGRAGEIAVANVLRETNKNFEFAFADSSKDSMADIFWGDLRIDVKTWSEKFWPKWGRCIAVKQYMAIKQKATHIIWCTTDIVENDSNWHVNLIGWNLIEEIQSFPMRWTGPKYKQVYNFQADYEQLRTMNNFFETYK